MSLGKEVHNIFYFVDEVSQKRIVEIYHQTETPSVGDVIHLDVSIKPEYEVWYGAERTNQDYVVKNIKRRYFKYYPASGNYKEVAQGSETYIFVEAVDDK